MTTGQDMSDDDNGDDREKLTREATRIFMRLEESPEDINAQTDRDLFVARGSAEKQTYDRVARAWGAAQKKPRPGGGGTKMILIAGALGLALTGYMSYDPIRLALLADVQTAHEPLQIALDSGDFAHLDAATAIVDDTDDALRSVRLLDGVAFFDVATDERRFVVSTPIATVTVLGTAFEVSDVGDAVVVSVVEGRVEIQAGPSTAILEAGERARATEDGIETTLPVEAATVAAWREDRIITDGMSVAEVVDVIDRRLPGHIFVIGRVLSQQEVTGGLDLTNPMQALQTLAAVRGARVITTIPGVTLLVSES